MALTKTIAYFFEDSNMPIYLTTPLTPAAPVVTLDNLFEGDSLNFGVNVNITGTWTQVEWDVLRYDRTENTDTGGPPPAPGSGDWEIVGAGSDPQAGYRWAGSFYIPALAGGSPCCDPYVILGAQASPAVSKDQLNTFSNDIWYEVSLTATGPSGFDTVIAYFSELGA